MTHDKPAAHFAPDEKSANLEAQTMPDTQAQDATRKPGTASAGPLTAWRRAFSGPRPAWGRSCC